MDERRPASFKIVIRRIEKPFKHSPENEFEWICRSLGFFEEIDRDKVAAHIFKQVVAATEKGRPLTSTELAEKVGMSRGSVVNHLNNLQRSGLVVRSGRQYLSRSRSMVRTIEEIEEDIDRIFAKMKKTAKEIDEEFGLKIEE
ncbi:MAG: helix-turn-helix transcriptional regulator [Candidatus Diapherotrites archaeon]|nr:helix-turn-helix transcriptional regulator [Candidatus Diapherotrites archaeon]